MSDPSSDMTADSTAAGLTNATPSSGNFNPPPWAPAPTNYGTANAGLSSAAAGSTAEGRDTYDRVSAQWSKLIAWWSADSDHHGLAWIQPQIAHWQQLATSGYQISMADLLNTKQDLELCISYAVPQGYEDDSSDSDSPLDAGLRAVAAPFKAIGEIAALPFTLPFKLGEAAGKVLDGGLPDTPTFTVPSWIWWGLGLGAAGAAWMFYKSTQVAVRAAPALLPLVAPEAMPYLAALQAARGTAPAPTAAPATYDPLQVLAAAFGPRGSRALDRFAQIGSAADAGTPPIQQSGDVSATAAAPAAAVRRVVQHALDRLPPELGARSYLRDAAAATAGNDDQGPATQRSARGAR
jgi:hypothetical protein